MQKKKKKIKENPKLNDIKPYHDLLCTDLKHFKGIFGNAVSLLSIISIISKWIEVNNISPKWMLAKFFSQE